MSEEARFDLARKLTQVDAQQRYSFLEATVSAMDAHMRYYQRSAEVRACSPPSAVPLHASKQALSERVMHRLRHTASPGRA